MAEIKIGFNEATAMGCKGQSLALDLEAAEKNGFDYIEIRFDHIREYLKEYSLSDLKAWFSSHHLKPWAYNTLIYFNQRDYAGKLEIDEEIDFIIEISEAIGMKHLVTVPSLNVGQLTIEQIRDEAVERLLHISDKISPYDLNVSLEFIGVPQASINQFGPAYEIVKKVNRSNVGILLDTYQFHGMGSKYEDLEKADPDKIFMFHLNDVENLPIGALTDINRVWPGEGVVDLKRMFGILKDKDWSGVVTIEEFRPAYYELSHAENVKKAYETTKWAVDKFYNASLFS